MNIDYQYINELTNLLGGLDNQIGGIKKSPQSYPLDKDIRNRLDELKGLITENATEYAIYQHHDKVQQLWIELIKKSIQCLRYFDVREPFVNNETKHPLAYGISQLDAYYQKYRDFENVMYGGVKYYRDHVVHVVRVWLLGCVVLLRNDCAYMNNIMIDEECTINPYEKLSIWTLIALTHDLGYPLEKASKIIDTTRDMMTAFISNLVVSMDLSFNGVQNSMNDFILRLMSSKMHKISEEAKAAKEEKKEAKYVARLQSKYYFKFQKSLEHNKHGVLSAIIIYKLLLYFLESDFTINEDYTFKQNDVKQFYIRRDILRAIASHTCSDVYQMDQNSFSFLLIICDDAQTWGRKGISELYVNKKSQYDFRGINFEVEKGTWRISDSYEVNEDADANNVLSSFKRQCMNYMAIFRDGQETTNRNFNFVWDMTLKVKRTEFQILFTANKDEKIQIALKHLDENQELNPENKTVSTFDKIFGYKHKEGADMHVHVCDFINAEI